MVQIWRLWQQHDYSAGNSTLGFESVLVVAPNDVPEKLHWRKEGLITAANYTGLDLEIPSQREWSDEEIEELKEAWLAHNEKFKEGNAYSWLGHLNVLKVAATRTTSLVLEDDADWDVQLRTQMPRVAEAVRELTGYAPALQKVGGSIQDVPFGTEWDVLWLGHCGDKVYEKPPPVTLDDPTVPPYYKSIWSKMNTEPNHERIVHWAHGPMCTYAYAITGEAAQKLIDHKGHGTTDFDVWLHILCKQGLRCVSVNPELFHHHEMAGEKTSLINGVSPDKEKLEKETTKNIWHSARCNSVAEGDELVECMGLPPKPKDGG